MLITPRHAAPTRAERAPQPRTTAEALQVATEVGFGLLLVAMLFTQWLWLAWPAGGVATASIALQLSDVLRN